MKILFICVNYNSDSDTLRYVSSIRSHSSSHDYQVVVVDNTERENSDDLIHRLHSLGSRIICLHPSKNLGYFGGARLGLNKYLTDHELPDWIVVSNVDVRLKNAAIFEQLKDMKNLSNLGVVAPAIYRERPSEDQNPHLKKRPSALRMQFYKLMFRGDIFVRFYWLLKILYNASRALLQARLSREKSSLSGQFAENTLQQIYAAHGSFLIFHRNYFEQGGTLDHGAFLFGEEITVAETVKKLKLKMIYNQKIKIEHMSKRLTRTFMNKTMAMYFKDSAAHCADRYFSR